ncbi:hypothetical protein [Azohydromonas caseinilytica]|uniref:Uncharacterized protein n=1 Tax=Azohydromonas caseinilytica TaxID=2728836 RepID=A0A848FCY0_9BURK|nr:hypothetical protein [Azohydromonas caseinilytica]NML18067.1 hypothetical protein [Azohydromonas caseinilytica]
MLFSTLFTRLSRHLSRLAFDEARQRLLALADHYEPTQPSYAADLRETALRHAPSSARAAPRSAGDWHAWITNTGTAAR